MDILQSWERSFNSLLIHSDGIKLFEVHLKSEFSEENIQFWKACERFKTLPDHQIEAEAAVIYEEFIDPQASKLVGGCSGWVLTVVLMLLRVQLETHNKLVDLCIVV